MSNSQAWRAFKHRNYRLLYPASAMSNIGTWAQRVAQDWLVLELTGSAQILGIVTGLQFAPTLFLSLWAGSLADKFDKRKLLYITNFGAGIVSAWLGLLIVSGSVEIWHVYVAALSLGVFSALDAPVRTSFTSELVGRTDLPGSNPPDLIKSIQTQIFPLPDTMTIYSGHGPVTTWGREKKANPYILHLMKG